MFAYVLSLRDFPHFFIVHLPVIANEVDHICRECVTEFCTVEETKDSRVEVVVACHLWSRERKLIDRVN